MKLIRRNGELVTFGTLRAWKMLLECPEKTRLQIWGSKIIELGEAIWKSESGKRSPLRHENGEEIGGELNEFWTL